MNGWSMLNESDAPNPGGPNPGAPAPKAEYAAQPPVTIETIDNHVFFYAPVDSSQCLTVLRDIRRVDAQLRMERVSRELPDDIPLTPIWLHVHSYGGNLFAGLDMADQLAAIPSPVYSVVEGVVASAATLITMACTKRFILPNSFVLVHQLTSFVWGKYEEFKDEMKLLDAAMDRLVMFYVARSRLGEAEIREMLKHDTWLSATECIEHGFVDGFK